MTLPIPERLRRLALDLTDPTRRALARISATSPDPDDRPDDATRAVLALPAIERDSLAAGGPPPPLAPLCEVAFTGGARRVAPPPRRWLVKDWLPAGELCMLFGPGEAGKSLLALQLARAAGTDRDVLGAWAQAHRPAGSVSPDGAWLSALRADPISLHSAYGQPPLRFASDPWTTIYCGWEDGPDEIHRREHRAAIEGGLAYACDTSSDDRVLYLPMRGRGPLHAPGPHGSQHIATVPHLTEEGARVRALCEARAASLLILDPVSLAFATDDTARALVSAVLGDWSGWALASGCTVLLVGHPNRSGDYAGSQAWQGLTRAQLALDAPRSSQYQGLADHRLRYPNERIAVLRLCKGNYASPHDRALWLRLSDGAWRLCPPFALTESRPSSSARSGAGPGRSDVTHRGGRPDAPSSWTREI